LREYTPALCYSFTVKNSFRFLGLKIREALEQLPYLPRALVLVWEAAGKWTLAWSLLLLCQATVPVLTVILSRSLVDSVVAHVSPTETASAGNPLVLAAMMAFLLLSGEVIKALMGWVRAAQAELVSDHIRLMIQDKASSLDMAFYDSPKYFDTLHRARYDAQSRPIALVESLGGLLQGTLTLLSMAVILAGYAWWLPLLLLVSTIPALFVVFRFILRRHQWRVSRTTETRRTLYYEYLQTSRETLPEIRLYDLATHFRELFANLRSRLRGELLQLERSEAVARIAAAISGLIFAAGALFLMLLDVLDKTLSLGQFAMFGQAFIQGQKVTRGSLENVGQIYSNLIFLGNLFEFLELESHIHSPGTPTPRSTELESGIRFRDISFRYPASSRPALEEFNLEIPAGQTTAIIGPNGAGKSTLFKLLLRLYDPDAGSIEIDGVDLRDLDIQVFRNSVAVLFQVPLQFSATLGENISYGNLELADREDLITKAIEDADATRLVSYLPEGQRTMLGPWFGGTELSVGQWQRLALSRAFLRDASLILLDEPTSAMDSWSEAEWIQSFRRQQAGKTVVIITHRLHTARQADIIHVMDNRGLVESGKHEELLRRQGLYTKAWAAHGFESC